MLKYLRIAVTALSLTACVLLIVLWVRSYSTFDQFARLGPNRTYYGCTSAQGRILLGYSNDPMLYTVHGTNPIRRRFNLESWDKTTDLAFFPARLNKVSSPAIFPWPTFRRDFYMHYGKANSCEITLPYWMLAATFGGLVAFPWLPWSRRFSLRTLLIATTLVAVGLGVIVALS